MSVVMSCHRVKQDEIKISILRGGKMIPLVISGLVTEADATATKEDLVVWAQGIISWHEIGMAQNVMRQRQTMALRVNGRTENIGTEGVLIKIFSS